MFIQFIIHRIFLKVIDNLIPDFDICFNKDFIDIVEAPKYLHPFDSFASVNTNDMNFLHNHYLVGFPGHNDKNLLLNEHTYYQKRFINVFEKEDL